MENEIYISVREEILYNQTKKDTYTNIAYVTTVAIWTISFSVNNKWITFLPLIILLPICLRIANCRRSIAFMSAYILICIQTPKHEYEHMVNSYYQKYGRRNHIFSRADLLFLSTVSILLFWIMNGWRIEIDNFGIGTSCLILVLQLFSFFFQLFVFILSNNIDKLKVIMKNNWEQVCPKIDQSKIGSTSKIICRPTNIQKTHFKQNKN